MSLPTRPRRARDLARIHLETLDDRLLLSTFTVSNLNDSGAGSFRAALTEANATPGRDTVDFSVSGTISLASALPAITDSVDIDGTTPSPFLFKQSPVVEIDFNGFDGMTFAPKSIGSSLKSLGLVDAGSDALTLNDKDNLITGNYIGVGLDGVTAIPNRGFGLTINAPSTGNLIGSTTTVSSTVLPKVSNLISGNLEGGIVVRGSSGNRFTANYIGTNAAGTSAVANGGDGLRFEAASNNTVGGIIEYVNTQGLVPLSNLLSGNQGAGLRFANGSSNNFIAGNFIGTNNTGNAPLGNHLDGVTVEGGSNENNFQGTVDFKSPFVYANIISGNDGNGMRVASSNKTIIQANFFGLGYDNMTPVGNGLDGLLVEGTSNTVTFGGNIPLGNVTAANGRHGVELRDSVSGFTAFNTFAGIDAFQQYTNLGNALDGFYITATGGNNLIRTNVISSNKLNGVELGGSATGVQVADNEIGVSTNGKIALPNGGNGVVVGGSAFGNMIGGKLDGFSIIPHNAISGNVGHGILFTGTAHNNAVTYSFIGSDLTGSAAVPNGGSGIFLAPGTANNTIGGTATDSFNVISGNLGNGIQLSGTSGNLIAGNFIGTDQTGRIPLVNGGNGILINSSSTNRIAGNTIAFNAANGVFVQSGNSNAIVSNSIFDNGSKGIVLGRGANQSQTSPVLSFLKRCNNRSAIRGMIKSLANLPYRIEFFASSGKTVKNPASGQTPLGSISVTTNERGVAKFLFFLKTLPKNSFFTATATSTVGDSSEFSNAIPKR